MSLTPRADIASKNWIINGEMRFAQRGTSFASVASGGYGLDRWVVNHTGTAVQAISQDATDFPSVTQAGWAFQNSMRFNLTTAQAVLAAGDASVFAQRIEGFNFRALYGKTFTLGFWVKATLPGIYCVWFQNNAANRSYVSEYTINATATWEYKTVTVTHDITGTWLLDNSIGMRVGWTIASGTGGQGTANVWTSSGIVATANQVNGVANLVTAADFRITGVTVIEGDIDSPAFVPFGRDVGAELAACQRYYEKTYDITTNPGTVSFNGVIRNHPGSLSGTSTISATWQFKVSKRAVPSITIYGSFAGTLNDVSITANANPPETSDVAGTIEGTGFNSTTARNTTAVAIQSMSFHATADAEI